MDLNVMIKELIESGIIENQELGLGMLASDKLTDQERRQHIDKFIEDYLSNKVDFTTELQRNVFKAWVEIYNKTLKDEVKNRVTKIK